MWYIFPQIKVLGSPNDTKLPSCMTLFYLISRDKCFLEVLNKYFHSELDEKKVLIAINQTLKF